MSRHIEKDEFDQACERRGVKLLLGNGFSQAFDREIFHYKELLNKAELGTDEAIIRSVFQQLKTVDFEQVVKALQRTAMIGSRFIDGQVESREFKNRLLRAAKTVKKSLGEAISELHPEASTSIPRTQYDRTREFIRKFDQVFTVNYDLLLYWIYTRDAWYNEVGCDDGFRKSNGKLVWRKRTASDQTVFYLHGALHYRETAEGLSKTRFQSFNNIMQQVIDALAAGEYPLLVAEGSYSAKIKRIQKSPYLVHCFEKFRSLSGSLVVYGLNLNSSDSHIIRAIEESKIRSIYFGLYGNIRSRRNNKIMGKITELETELSSAKR